MPDGGVSFDETFTREFSRLLRVAHLIVGDGETAAEIVQETFARALIRWERISRYEDPPAWLMTVTVRQAVRARERARREIRGDRDDQVAEGGDLAGEVAARVPVAQALVQLSAQQRAVVVLHYLEGFTVAEIAERLGTSAGTVKTHLWRARSRVATVIGEDVDAEEPR